MFRWHPQSDDISSLLIAEKTKIHDDLPVWESTYYFAWNGCTGVHSNPLVGASLVDSHGVYLGSAAHLIYGQGHAEVNLIKYILEKYGSEVLNQATLYCSLEPCAHKGKTQSCAQFLTQFPLKQVLYAQKDPNPLVNGKGEAILKKAGISCELIPQPQIPFEKLTERFVHNLKSNRPFVGLKVASTLDGIYAPKGTGRYPITGEKAIHYGHWLRRVYQGIAVGAKTVIQDNPSLSARHPDYPHSHPWKIIFDPHLEALHFLKSQDPNDINLFQGPREKIIWLITEEKKEDDLNYLNSLGIPFLAFPYDSSQGFPLDCLLPELKSRGILSLLLEGGGDLWSSFLNQGFVDRKHIFQNPRILGQDLNLHWTRRVKSHISTFSPVDIYPLGDDLLWEFT